NKLPEPARGQWVVRIEPSNVDPNVAYVATNAYRIGDDRPTILRTGDLGKTWQSVVGDLPANASVEVVREDLVNPKLLYAGTHFGLFASFDQGTHWVRIGDVPPVRVDDIQIHPRTADLVIATHGRSIAVLDDSTPFREFTPEIAARAAGLRLQRGIKCRHEQGQASFPRASGRRQHGEVIAGGPSSTLVDVTVGGEAAIA